MSSNNRYKTDTFVEERIWHHLERPEFKLDTIACLNSSKLISPSTVKWENNTELSEGTNKIKLVKHLVQCQVY